MTPPVYPPKPEFTYAGELPKGDWRFLLVSMAGKADAIVVVDMSGDNPPRMIIRDKLVTIRC